MVDSWPTSCSRAAASRHPLVGAISVLAERGYRFERVAGTSAGAIVGSLIAADIKPAELLDLMQKIDYRSFRDPNLLDRLGPPGQLASLVLAKGIYEGKYLHSWVSEQLAAHGVHSFKDLRARTATARFRRNRTSSSS